jgi:glycogen operon protein
MLNAHWQHHFFEVPKLPRHHEWYRIIDTALPSPDDFCEVSSAPAVVAARYRLEPRSVVVLKATM